MTVETTLTPFGFAVVVDGLPVITVPAKHRARAIAAHLERHGSTDGLEEFAAGYVSATAATVRHVRRFPFGVPESVDYADEHESGQLRLGVPGEQRPLLPLPDEQIPQAGGDEATSVVDTQD